MKVGRALGKLMSRVEINLTFCASDKVFRAWSDQPLFDKYVSALAKPRILKCSVKGSRDATNVKSTLGGTYAAAGRAGALVFGGFGRGSRLRGRRYPKSSGFW
jgi:hypothetical protein